MLSNFVRFICCVLLFVFIGIWRGKGNIWLSMAEVDPSIKKRVRSSNWDEEEKRLLRQLIIERIDVIENKDASTNTNMKKKAAWQEVLSCFNSLNNKKRVLKELTTQWRNMKGKVKTRDSEYKRAKSMTGGGPPPPSPPPEDLEIIQAIPNEFIIDNNKFDSDSLHINSIDQSLTSGSPQVKIQDDPWTPSLASNKQIKDTEEMPEDEGWQEAEVLCPTPKAMSNKYIKKCKPKQKKIHTEDCEQELFLIVKRSKERECERAEEIHKKKIAILDLEYEYWKKKLNSIE